MNSNGFKVKNKTFSVDLFRNGGQIKYSLVLMLISLSSLATTSKFQKNICFKMRAVGLININTKEWNSGRHLWKWSIESTVNCSLLYAVARQTLKLGDFTLLFCGARQRNTLKCVQLAREFFPFLTNSVPALWRCRFNSLMCHCARAKEVQAANIEFMLEDKKTNWWKETSNTSDPIVSMRVFCNRRTKSSNVHGSVQRFCFVISLMWRKGSRVDVERVQVETDNHQDYDLSLHVFNKFSGFFFFLAFQQ